MNNNNNIKRLFLLLALTTVLVGCAKDSPHHPVNKSDYIGLVVTAPDAETRAADSELSNVQANGFKVWATTNTNPNTWFIGGVMHQYDGDEWNFVPNPISWPLSGAYPVTFYALYPASPVIGPDMLPTGMQAMGAMMNQAPGYGTPGTQAGYRWWLYYIIPVSNTQTTASLQQDVLVGVETAYSKPMSGRLNIRLKHIFTSIGFKVFGDGDRVSSIRVTGVLYRDVVGSTDGTNITWLHRYPSGMATGALLTSSPNNNDPSLPPPSHTNGYQATLASNPYTTGVSGNILAPDGRLMMIPQTVGGNAWAILTFADGQPDMRVSLTGQTWEMGDRLTYMINCPGTSLRADSPFELPAWIPNSVGSVMKKLDVKCIRLLSDGQPAEDPSQGWMLTSSAPSWLRLSDNPNTSFDALSSSPTMITGSGSKEIYVYVSDYYGDVPRSTDLVLQGTSILTLTVTQNPSSNAPDLETPQEGGEW